MDDLDEGSLCCLGCTAALGSMLVLPAGTAACPTCGEPELADAASAWALIVGEQLASLEAAGISLRLQNKTT